MSRPDQHRFFVTIDGEGSMSFHAECPYEPADEDRPCRVHTEDGEPDPDFPHTCNYQEWLECCDEMTQGERTIELDGAWWDWSNGDYPVLRIEPEVQHRSTVSEASANVPAGPVSELE